MSLFLRKHNETEQQTAALRSIFKKREQEETEITQDMSPDEIAEIVSEKMIAIVREQINVKKEAK